MGKVAKTADPNRCCAILGGAISLSLEAESRGRRGLWLNGIHRILASVKKVDRNVVAVPPESVKMIFLANYLFRQAIPAPLQLAPSAMGRFKKYDLVAPGTSTCQEVTVWFSSSTGRLGALFWANVGSPMEENR